MVDGGMMVRCGDTKEVAGGVYNGERACLSIGSS